MLLHIRVERDKLKYEAISQVPRGQTLTFTIHRTVQCIYKCPSCFLASATVFSSVVALSSFQPPKRNLSPLCSDSLPYTIFFRHRSVLYQNKNKEIIKIRSRQHEHTPQCDGPAWFTRERGAVNSSFPFIDGVSLPTTLRWSTWGGSALYHPLTF
jgi:hypothetical protein